MLDNVTGILRAFKDENGKSFHAWYEVAKVFASIGYVPVCLHINSKLAGIAQNRPRFIMIAVRFDHYNLIAKYFDIKSSDAQIFAPFLKFYYLPFGHLDYLDATKSNQHKLFEDSFLSTLLNGEKVTVCDALNDLKKNHPSGPSEFITDLNTIFKSLPLHRTPKREIYLFLLA
jgi:DNA (cytosine-5)-methyltransferase 1